MGRKCLIAIVLILLLPVGAFAGKKSLWEVKLPFNGATIHYTIRGVENGTEVKYIRDFGNEVATYHTTKTSMMGMTIVNETVEINTSDWLYKFDLSKRTGTKSVNPQKYMIEEYNKLSQAERKKVEENAEKMGPSMADGFGGSVQQNAEKILGYSCDRTEIMGTVAYNIHGTGIPLRVESSMMGMNMKIEATSVDEGQAEAKFFQLPQGIEPKFDSRSDAMAREMAKQTISMLKDPASKKNMGGASKMQMPGQQQLAPEEQEQMDEAMKVLKGMFGKPNQQ